MRVVHCQWKPHWVAVVRSNFTAARFLHDLLHHSAAVVGLNTSAQIEAGILGKPVFTLLAEGFEHGQQGTLHFHYLLKGQGGFVEMAQNLDEHMNHLDAAFKGAVDTEAIREAVARFIRPHGWHQPATPILAEAICSLAPTRSSAVRRWLSAR